MAKAKHILPIALSIIAVATAGAAIVKTTKNETTKQATNIVTSWEVGTLSGETGKKVSATNSIRTRDYVKASGLNIDVDDEAQVEYKLYLYDKDKDFLDVTTSITDDYVFATDYVGAHASEVTYVKIVVDVDDDDVSWFEVPGYASAFNIKVAK